MLFGKKIIRNVMVWGLLSLCGLLVPLRAQQKESEWQAQSLQGKVKTLEEKEYAAIQQTEPVRGVDADFSSYIDTETGVVSHQWTQFTRKGHIAEEKFLDEKAHVTARTVYKYTEMGDLTELVEYNERGKKSGKTLYTYNSNRQFATETVFLSDGSMESAVYYYNTDRLLDSVVWKTPQGFRVEANRYNARKQLVEKRFLENGQLKERRTFTFQSEGDLLLEEAYWKGDGTLDHRFTYSYDARRQLTAVTKWDKAGKMESINSWEYDPYGNITSDTWHNELGEQVSSVRYLYRYDDRHNWVGQMSLDENRRPNTVIERVLTYY